MRACLATALLLTLAIPFAACSTPGPRLLGDGAGLVRQSIRTAWTAHVDAARRGDVDGLLAIYTDDAVYTIEGSPPVRGKQALATMERRGLKAGEILQSRNVTEALRVDGNLAFELGAIHADVKPSEQEPQHVIFHYVAMWQLGADRQWRIAHLVGQVEAVLVADAKGGDGS
ncbi:MAG: SgcJ/EcaC family oxidoreductase [Planctomycetota bacterium]